ncbi:MAG: universal stress protein [Burkholderiaceae bacterium]|nr:universal stress protein [Burkholderiaceae bacterium]
MKILLAVDGSSFTRRMLSYLAVHDELLGSSKEMTALTVVPPIAPRAHSQIAREIVQDYYEWTAAEVFKPVQAFARQNGWQLACLSQVGDAAVEIARCAEEGKYDLICMGSHGHSSVAGVALGSVVTKVLARCRVPLLIIR